MQLRGVGVEHRQHGDLAPRALGLAVEPQRRLERREAQLVEPQRARQRVARGGGDRLGAPDHQAGLRPAEQLVAREADERGARGHGAAHRRLLAQDLELGQVPRADVVDHRHAERAQLLDRDLLDEAELAEVRRVRAQQRAGALADRALVVGAPRAVGRADLDERRAGLRDHLGHAEAAADLDELPARDDDLAPRPGQRRGREQHRAGAVVDRQRRLGARQLAQQSLDVAVARPAHAVLPLEVRVALGRPCDRFAGGLGERRAPEVRVHDHAGRVEHAPQRRPLRRPRPLPRARHQVDLAAVPAGQQLRAPLLDHRARRRPPRSRAGRRPAPPAGRRPAASAAQGASPRQPPAHALEAAEVAVERHDLGVVLERQRR